MKFSWIQISFVEEFYILKGDQIKNQFSFKFTYLEFHNRIYFTFWLLTKYNFCLLDLESSFFSSFFSEVLERNRKSREIINLKKVTSIDVKPLCPSPPVTKCYFVEPLSWSDVICDGSLSWSLLLILLHVGLRSSGSTVFHLLHLNLIINTA